MATLQKFKLLATQCGVAQSPTRSPRTSPVVHFRRRKTTLRMLLGRSSGRRSPRRRDLPDQPRNPVNLTEKKEKDLVGRTLKELFVSSPKLDEDEAEIKVEIRGKSEVFLNNGGGGEGGLGGGPGSPRPVWTGFRFRSRSLLRRAWRPVLVTIPE